LPVRAEDDTFPLVNTLLEVPEIRQRAFPVSVELYHRLTEGLRTELLRGTIIEKMSKSPFHIFVANRLLQILQTQVGGDVTVLFEGALTTADSEPEPDLAIVRGPLDRYRSALPGTAELVIEVAVTSVQIDRIKANIYAEAGVKEYWIVRAEEQEVEVYRQPGPQGYAERTVVAAPAVLECAALAGVRVDLGALFA
jgi:Uma2 family endonuclease